MAGVGHSTLLKFLHDIPSNTMSERSPTIESQVPGLQQFRSVTRTTLDEPEHTVDDNIQYREKSKHAKRPTGVSETDYIVDDKKDVTLPEEENDSNGDFVKSLNTREDLNDEKGFNATNFASDEEAVADKDDFVYSPVITVTKEESSFTKGDLKLQKVVVSEDVSDESMVKNKIISVTEASSPVEVRTEIRSDVLPVTIRLDQYTAGNNDKKKTGEEEHKDSKKNQTRIPKLRFKQAIERVRKERQDKRNTNDPKPFLEQKRRSSIPKLKDISKNSPQGVTKVLIETKKDQELESPKVDDEFDKIYEEIIESEASNDIPSPDKISNPIKLESKFEEIIHAYDENNVQSVNECENNVSIEKTKSKIPLLKRKSEQEIEIPPPSHRKYSFKRSNTEDYKNKTPAMTKEKSMKSDDETVRHGNTSVKSGTISKNKTDSLGNANPTIMKSEATQKNIEMKKELMRSLTETVVKSENISNSNVNDATKCKIPVALNTKDSLDTKINSATLNKHPARLNIKDRISNTVTDKKDKLTDKNVGNSPPQYALNVKSSTLLEEDKFVKQDVKHILGTKNIDDKVIEEKPTSLSQESKTSQIQSMDIEQQTETINNMSTIPNSVTKYGRVTKNTDKGIVSSENLCSPQSSPPHAQLTAINGTKYVNEVPLLTEKQNYQETEPKSSHLILESSKSTTDPPSNVKTNPNKNSHVLPSQNENESKISISETSNFTVKINLADSKHDVKLIKEDQTMKELTASNIGAQPIKICNDNNKAQDKDKTNFKTDPKIDVKINYESKEITMPDEKEQTFNKIELTLKSPIRTTINENNFKKEGNLNTQNILKILPENNKLVIQSTKQLDDRLKQPFSTSESDIKNVKVPKPLISKSKITDDYQAALVTGKNQTDLVNEIVLANTEPDCKKVNDTKLENLPVKSTNAGEEAEEDIIMLKGKVNRVIRRLDSKDYKTVKKELDDVPKEVSVTSKIALFERCESKDPVSKSYEEIEPLKEDVVNDKPKIVNEILKMDYNQNELNCVDESIHASALDNTVNNEKTTTSNDFEANKVNRNETKDLKTKNISSERNKINRTISSVNNEVFAKDAPSSSQVWQEYRRKKEDSDMRRARSLAELDLGDAVKGRVKQLVVRMSSVDRGGASRREHLEGRGRPRGGTVSQRIAMYESKLTSPRGDAPPARPPPQPVTTEENSVDEEQLRSKIDELTSVNVTYGRFEEMASMELSDGGTMPVLSLGTAMLEPALLRHVIHAGIDLGYRAIDSAYIYGNEREVGQAIRDKIQDGTVTRSELFIINKLWSTFHRRDLVEAACRQSLDAMGLDYFDLYLIHNPMSFKEGPNPVPKIAGVLQYSSHDYLEAWFGVEGLISRGLARRGGLSNFNSQQVDRIVEKARIKPVINQVESHPYLTQLRLEEFCASRNIKLSCFGVLGSKGTPAELTSGLSPAIDDPLVQVMAAGLGVTPAQLLISYQLQLGRSVVVKCSSAAHLAQARAAAPSSSAPVRLQPTHVAALNALNRNKRTFTFKGMGDTHKNYPFRIPF
ncbi:uncharacterized protein [Maniola hyperantus]|uniref:uncharacterized protein n=1 Tax=Aphantopus hyperantus TaxID=2795564 RepID=UPI003749C664